MTELEQDKLEAEKNCHRLKQTIDAMKASAKNTDKLEVIIGCPKRDKYWSGKGLAIQTIW